MISAEVGPPRYMVAAWITQRAGSSPAPVATAAPSSIGAASSLSRWIAGPPAREIAPATPPPWRSSVFAALAIASTSSAVTSPSMTSISATRRAYRGVGSGSSERSSDHAFRHQTRRHVPRLRVARPHGHHPHAERAPGRRPADPHTRPRPLLPEGAPAAPRAGRLPAEDRGGLHPDRHDLDRRAPRAPGVPPLGRRAVDLPLRPRADRPEGPRHPGVHRPRARPDDPAHARAQARAGRPQHLQRLLVLGPAVRLRPLARPARRHQRDPPGLGPEHAGAARGLGRGRPVALPRLG